MESTQNDSKETPDLFSEEKHDEEDNNKEELSADDIFGGQENNDEGDQPEKENDISINQNLGKAYFVQNLNLGYLHNEFISLDFEIINLFNTNYSDLLGAIMPKRWLIVGLEVKI